MSKRLPRSPASCEREEVQARLARALSIETEIRSASEAPHQLLVHQVELEMQIEELRRALTDLEESCDRNLQLYEFAPVGCLRLAWNALIDAINRKGTDLLGADRETLLRRGFVRCVAFGNRDRWQRFFVDVAKQCRRLSCEPIPQRADGRRALPDPVRAGDHAPRGPQPKGEQANRALPWHQSSYGRATPGARHEGNRRGHLARHGSRRRTMRPACLTNDCVPA